MASSGPEGIAGPLRDRLRVELAAPTLDFRRSPTPIGGGRFSAVFTFELAAAPTPWEGPLVIRLVGTADQARLEAALHEATQAGRLQSPPVLLCEPDANTLGHAFLVMRRLPGRSYLRGVEPWRFALDLPKIFTAWPRRFAAVITALGQADAEAARRALDRHEVPTALTETGRHLRSVTSSLAGEPSLRGILSWLQDERPAAPERPTIVHGDLWPGNVFVRRGKIGLIDWTRGALDDPALDVGFAKIGFALMPEPFPPPPPIREVAHLAGTTIARGISRHADHLVGGSDRVRYYEALRCAVELADVVASRNAGGRAGWEHGVPALVRHLEHISGRRTTFT